MLDIITHGIPPLGYRQEWYSRCHIQKHVNIYAVYGRIMSLSGILCSWISRFHAMYTFSWTISWSMSDSGQHGSTKLGTDTPYARCSGILLDSLAHSTMYNLVCTSHNIGIVRVLLYKLILALHNYAVYTGNMSPLSSHAQSCHFQGSVIFHIWLRNIISRHENAWTSYFCPQKFKMYRCLVTGNVRERLVAESTKVSLHASGMTRTSSVSYINHLWAVKAILQVVTHNTFTLNVRTQRNIQIRCSHIMYTAH